MRTFKSSETLFAAIREDFASFDNAGLIDEGTFHRHVKYILSLLGLMWYRDAEDIIEVCNYKATLPEDFKLLDAAWRCTKGTTSSVAQDGVVLTKVTFDHYPETQIPDWHQSEPCKEADFWKQPKSCIFNRHEEIVVQRDDCMTTYNNPILLRPGNVDTTKCCTKGCQNIHSTSDKTFAIRGNTMYTNFETGSIYISYHAFPIDDKTQLPMIPDEPVIEKCIEDYVKYNIIKYLWTNGDADVQQQVAFYKGEWEESRAQAMTVTKTPSFQAMVNKIRLTRKSLDFYQIC